MSSSNRVRVSVIAETVYGVTPGTGNFTEFRMTSEDLTGDPTVVESAELRSDRQSGGQTKTGLTMSGGINFQASADPSLKLSIEHAFMSDLVAPAVHTNTLTVGGGGTTLTTLGDLIADGLGDGDMVVLAGMDDPENNTKIMISNVVAGGADIVGVGLINGSGTGATATRPSYHQIGVIEKSMSISKEFLDLGSRNISYKGERVSEFTMTFAFGAIVTGRVAFAGNDYDTPALPITDTRTIDPSGTSENLDASNGFGWLLVDGADIDICMESLDFTLNNNLQPQNCVGRLAAKDQVPGSAAVTFNSTMHLGTNSWDTFMAAKVAQTPVSLAFYTEDSLGQGYGVVMERVQVNFPDPQASGRDANVTLGATGLASYDAAALRTMRVYIF